MYKSDISQRVDRNYMMASASGASGGMVRSPSKVRFSVDEEGALLEAQEGLAASPQKDWSPPAALLSQVRTALERSPSFARTLGMQLVLPPPHDETEAPLRERLVRPPSRDCWRHTFYTLIVIALVGVSAQLVVLRHDNQQQTEV